MLQWGRMPSECDKRRQRTALQVSMTYICQKTRVVDLMLV